MTERWSITLTGEVKPGVEPTSAWEQVRAELACDPVRFEQTIRQRLPVSFRAADENGAWKQLQALQACGVEAVLLADPGRRAWVRQGEQTCGPVSLVYARRVMEQSHWSGQTLACAEGDSRWQGLQDLIAAAEAEPPPPPLQAPSGPGVAEASGQVHPVRRGMLPVEDDAPGLHGGFWMRFVAYLLDTLIVATGTFVVGLVIGVGLVASGGYAANNHGQDLFLRLVGLALNWVYYACFESSALQATPGKLALGLRVVDMHGRRIGFGRASGRHFAKILSGITLLIGYMLAGWTERKQALHDLIAGCCVVRKHSLGYVLDQQPEEADVATGPRAGLAAMVVGRAPF